MLNAQTSPADMAPVETLPGNTELEQQVLGTLLSDCRLLERMGFLRPEHFFLPVHQRIFTAIREMCDSGRVASPVTLKGQFAQDEDLKACGGATYLARCSASPAILPVESARELVTLAQQRRLVESCRKAIAGACEGKILPAHIALGLAEECEAVAQGSDDFRLEDDLAVSDRILKGLTEVLTPVSTGLARLDKAMDGGLYPGKSYAFAAEKKTGKTVLLSTISRNLAMRGVKHLFIAAEMGSDEIHQRVLAGIADVYPSAFRSDYGKSQEFQGKVAEAALKCKGNILYRNAPGLSFDTLQRIATQAVARHRVKGIILDYWQLVRGQRKGQSTAEHLDTVAQWIADFGRKHKVWMLVAAQINQEGNTRGGEGIRLAFDQVYQIRRLAADSSEFWLQMMDTRYTKWMNVGTERQPGLIMREKGPYFEDA